MCATCQGLMDSSFFDTREKNRHRECGNWKKRKKMEQDNLIKKQNLFPRTTDIPQTLLKGIPCIQTGYLVDCKIQVWDGPRQEVLSPVWMANDNGTKPFSIGEYPHLHRAGSQKEITVVEKCEFLTICVYSPHR